MKTTVYRHVLMFVTLISICTTSGCSQSVSFDQKTGFTMDYPSKGANVATAVETMLNRFYDPRLSSKGIDDLTGPIRFEVTYAKVIKADQVVPRPDYYPDTFLIHCHLKISFLSGQSIECDDEEEFGGTWQGGRIEHVGIKFMSENPWAWMNREDVLAPTFLADVKAMVPPQTSSNQDDLKDYGTILPLMRSLVGRDMSVSMDWSSWLEAHQLAREYNGVFLPKPSGEAEATSSPAMASASPTVPPEPPAAAGTSQPALNTMAVPSGQWVDITVAPIAGGTFHIPIHDPHWAGVKDSLPKFQFDPAAWTQILGSVSHAEAEQQLVANLKESYARAQAQTRQANQPEMDRLARAAYLAQQPGATWAQKRAYANMQANEAPKLEKSTRFLEAVHILIVALQDDIRAASPVPTSNGP